MLKKIIIGLGLLVISGATTANAALLVINSSLALNQGDVHSVTGSTAIGYYEFVAGFNGGARFDVTPNQAAGNSAVSYVTNLVMTWDTVPASGATAHQITHPVTGASVTGTTVTFFHTLVSGTTYRLFVAADNFIGAGSYTLDVSAVPLPPSVIAFTTAMLGVGFLARRRRKQKALFS